MRRKKKSRWLYVCFILAALLVIIYQWFPLYQRFASAGAEMGRVVRVIDGDTVVLADNRHIRLEGINAPEVHHPKKGRECFGDQAKTKAEKLVLGKIVRLESDLEKTDLYKRELRYIWIDDLMVNEALVKEGFAWESPYKQNRKYRQRFQKAEAEALEQKLGMWGICDIKEKPIKKQKKYKRDS